MYVKYEIDGHTMPKTSVWEYNKQLVETTSIYKMKIAIYD